MSDLKPCPFCGGEARLTYSTDNHRKPYVTCDTPRCPGCNTYQWHYNTESEAIEAWNHRAERTVKPKKGAYDLIRCDCGMPVSSNYDYCPKCKAKLDWMGRGE